MRYSTLSPTVSAVTHIVPCPVSQHRRATLVLPASLSNTPQASEIFTSVHTLHFALVVPIVLPGGLSRLLHDLV